MLAIQVDIMIMILVYYRLVKALRILALSCEIACFASMVIAIALREA